MKTMLSTCLLTAAIITASMQASANHCPPGNKYKKHSYYDHPHHHHSRPMPMRPYYPHHSKPYWHADKHASQYRPGETASTAVPAATSANIIDTAITAGNFNTLIEALNSTGLVETLQGPGPFTVFAPSDEAFARIPQKILAAIMADKEALAELLSYHVVSGEVTAADVAMLISAETVQGSAISIDTSEGVKVDGANVVTADIRASNGIIHVIDTVMIPN